MKSGSRRWWHDPLLQVKYDPGAQAGEVCSVLVGIGRPDDALTDFYVALNHKLAPRETGQPWSGSLSEYVARAPAQVVAGWRQCFPLGMASVRQIVLDDTSLDTCMALLLFAQAICPDAAAQTQSMGAIQTHCAGTPDKRLTSWLAYVTDWEGGRYTDGHDKRLSAACMMAVLAHSLLPDQTQADKRPSDATAREALTACLTLLDGYIARNEQACLAQPPIELPEYDLAAAHLEFEQQQYLLALKYGTKTQLSLPLVGSTRRLLVDALFLTDFELTGMLKILARTDTERSWTKRGFTVLGVYRPALAGTGNDMTISVDPSKGLTLSLLWEKLEAMETDRWQGLRPCNEPRHGVAKYTNAITGQPIPGSPNQPWYDERGNYTLVGAPKSVAPGVPGTRLSWYDDVLAAMWGLYVPFAVPLSIESLARTSGGTVAVVRWPKGEASAAGRTPALHGWLATCSAAGQPSHPGNFVETKDIHVMSMPGGDLIAHPHGVTLFDDWSASALDVPHLKEVAMAMAQVVANYRDLLEGSELAELLDLQQQALKQAERVGFRRVALLRSKVLALKAKLMMLSAREASLPLARGATELREILEKAWGLPDTRHRLWDTVTQLDDVLAQAQALLQERRQYLSTAIVSVAGLFFVLRDGLGVVADYMTMNKYEMLRPLAEKMDVSEPAIKALKDNAKIASTFDEITLLVMTIIFSLGLIFALSRYLGSRSVRLDV